MSNSANNHKLSFFVVVLMNINVTLGTGLFINTVLLSKHAGAIGGFTYALIGIWLLPLILTFTNMLRLYPIGGIYTFAKEGISPLAGFISTWTYFIGKLASATLAIHVAMSLLQTIIPTLRIVPVIALDIGIIITYTLLNLLNFKQGSKIQVVFTSLKLVPIIFIIASGLFVINPGNFASAHFVWEGLSSTIPLALFGFYGFESACNIALLIENPEKNASRAVITSHLLTTVITTLFQTLFYGSLGSLLASQANFLGAYPAFITTHISHNLYFSNILIAFMHIAIASSALGSSYGIIYGNAWNLYNLAKHKQIYFANLLSRLSKNNIAPWCIITEAIICLVYLLTTQGNQLYLQHIAVLALTICFTITSYAYFAECKRRRKSILTAISSLAICLILLGISMKSFIYNQLLLALVFYAIIVIAGIIMHIKIEKKRL